MKKILFLMFALSACGGGQVNPLIIPPELRGAEASR